MRVIDRKKAIEAIMDLENCPNGLSDTYDKARIIAELEEVPAIDAVEVVRCKDCKYYLRNKIYAIEGMPIMGNKVCKKWGGGCATDENGFCYMGERRESDG